MTQQTTNAPDKNPSKRIALINTEIHVVTAPQWVNVQLCKHGINYWIIIIVWITFYSSMSTQQVRWETYKLEDKKVKQLYFLAC